MADEEGHDHADEVGAQLGFECPVVPIDLLSALAFLASEAASI